MPAPYTSPFAAVPAFAKLLARPAIHIFQSGVRMHDGDSLNTIATALAALFGQNAASGQAPIPLVVSDLFSTGQHYRSFADGLVANPGGGQAGATPIVAALTSISTVATAGDSVALPAAVPGLAPLVANAGAAALAVFPVSGGTDIIGTGAANAAFAVPAGKSAQFFCSAPGRWRVLLSA